MGDTSSATIPETFQVSEQAMPSAMKVISEDIQGLNIVLLKITSGNVSVVGSVDKKVDLKALDDQRLQYVLTCKCLIIQELRTHYNRKDT